ncbi:MAG: hypothetical protein ABIR79_16535 [Candidatus Binatia bacterium]
MGSSLCTIYVWDHASNPERITLSTKTFFRRKREHYKLFKSTKAVMKQPSAGRGWLMLVPVLLLVSGFMFYRAFTKHGVDAVPVASAMAQGVPVAQSGWRSDPRLGLVPEKVSGCFMVGPKCSCLDGDFQPIRVTAELCKQSASSYSGLVKWRPRDALPAAAMQAGAAAKPADLSAFNPFKAASSPGA